MNPSAAVIDEYIENFKEYKRLKANKLRAYKNGIPLKILSIALCVFAVIDLAFILLIEFKTKPANPIHKEFWSDVNKSLLQVLVVFIIGSLVSVVVKRYDAYKAIEKSHDEFRKDALTQLHGYYADTKRVRRVLRATVATPPYHTARNEEELQFCLINLPVYDAQLAKLNDIQLSLELLVKDIELSTDTFAMESKKVIIENVDAMEKYLNAVIDEWEQKRGQYGEKAHVRIQEFPEFAQLLKRAKEHFNEHYIMLYKHAATAIRDDITSPPKMGSGM